MRCRRVVWSVALLCGLSSLCASGAVQAAPAQSGSKGCPGRTLADPQLPFGVCCVSGYVMSSGAIVQGALVTLYGPDGSYLESTFTSVDPVSDPDTHDPNPRYSFRLSVDQVVLQPGDTITLTAAVGHQRRTVRHVLRSGAQWVNIGSAPFDVDRDGRSDSAVFRPSDNAWYLWPSMQQQMDTRVLDPPGALPVPADYDGDGKADLATFDDGKWSIQGSADGAAELSLGQAGDVPMPVDYDGDADADPAVFRPVDGAWLIRDAATQQPEQLLRGRAADLPVAADFDGDHITDLGVFRPADGLWSIRASSDPPGTIGTQHWGQTGDHPVPADFDGDGKADLAVFRPDDGNWYIWQSATQTELAFHWGLSGDRPVPADYDGDGTIDIAVFRPDDGDWYVWQRRTSSMLAWHWGQRGDIPLPGAYVP